MSGRVSVFDAFLPGADRVWCRRVKRGEDLEDAGAYPGAGSEDRRAERMILHGAESRHAR